MKRKSFLFVPSKEKMLSKIVTFEADGYIIDLEDSINVDEKEEALKRAEEFLKNSDRNDIWIRINSQRAELELNILKSYNVGFMLPKMESLEQYARCREILLKHHVIALIETPKAILNLEDIAFCDYVDALAFGAEDYSAKMNMENNAQNLLYARNKILICAKAAQKAVYDTPSFQLNDVERFKEEVNLACNMGFDGKLCISPKHVSYIKERFGEYDFEFMKTIIDQYEQSGEAVFVCNNVVYEKMHIDRMKKILKENGEL